jgi:hypothetical protein
VAAVRLNVRNGGLSSPAQRGGAAACGVIDPETRFFAKKDQKKSIFSDFVLRDSAAKNKMRKNSDLSEGVFGN